MKIVSLLPQGSFDLVTYAPYIDTYGNRDGDRVIITKVQDLYCDGSAVYANVNQDRPEPHDPCPLWPYGEVHLGQRGERYGDFPEPEEGTIYVVSKEVAIALRGTRPDVYVLAHGVRNPHYGNPVGYAGLIPTAG